MIRKLNLILCMVGLGALGCSSGDSLSPRVLIDGPDSGLFSVNRFIEVDYTVSEEEVLELVTLSVDGVEVQRELADESCGEERRCTMKFVLDTLPLDDGLHTFTVSGIDLAGNVGEDESTIELGTGVGVDRIWFTNMPEDLLGDPSLEVEVALRDATTNQLIACTGGPQGMAKVDSDDVDYDNVSAFFTSPTQAGPILPADLLDKTLVAIVTEDDHEGCPAAETSDSDTVLGEDDDDFIGRSPDFSGADLEGGLTFEDFDDVMVLRMAFGRFFTHHNK